MLIRQISLAFLLLAAASSLVWGHYGGKALPGGGGGGPTITGIGLSNSSFVGGSASGTVVGVSTVSITGGSFTGSQSLTGADAASFGLTGCSGAICNLVTNGVLCGSPPCTYNINIVATQAGATGSPFTQAETITGTAAGLLSTTVPFVNDGGSTQAAGVPTQTFGWPFKQGDVPTGSWPIFTDPSNGHVQKQSYGLDTYWPDGSLKWASFMLLPDFSVGAGATKNISITCCGSKPANSGRALTDIYNQNIIINMLSAPISGSRLGNATGSTVTFSTWVDSAANTNNNNYKQVKWMDGDAGAAWRIDFKMSATKTGSPQGGLRVSEYVFALNNSAGGLGGFRHMPMVRQPAWNGAPLHFYGFATPDYLSPTNGPHWTASGVSAQPLAWHGKDGNPMSATNFVVELNPANCPNVGFPCYKTGASNNFWFGIGGCQMIPFYITTSGGATLPTTAPSQIDKDTIYYACSNQSLVSHPELYFSTSAINLAGLTVSTTGSGTFTMHPMPIIAPFMRIPFATNDGQYIFFQGGGTLTSETTLRAKFDQSYWLSTKTLPPFCNPTGSACPIQGTSNGGTGSNAVGDTTYAYDWNPMNATDWAANQQSGGDHLDIGPINGNMSIDFYNQSRLSHRLIRMNGLSASMAPFDVKDNATDVVSNLLSGTYTGMSAPGSGISQIEQTGAFIPPPGYPNTESGGGVQGIVLGAAFGSEHRPSYSAWPYIRTGELQFLDMLEDAADQGLALVCPQDRNPSASPLTGNGIALGYGGGGEFRATAWIWRDLVLTAGFYPYDPTGNATVYTNGGTQESAYFRQIGLNNALFTKQLLNPANNVYGAATSYLLTRGKYQGYPATGFCSTPAGAVAGGGTFELAYLMFGMNWYYALTGDTNILDMITAYATRENYVLSTFGGWFLYPYVEHNGVTISQSNAVNPPISSDVQWGVSPGNGELTQVSWVATPSPSSSVRAFTVPTNCCNFGYVLKNGDIWIWNIDSGQAPIMKSGVTNAATSVGTTLHFASTPSGLIAGMAVIDATTTTGFARVVSSTGTTVVVDNPISVASGDTINFSMVLEGQGANVYYIVQMNTGGGNYSFNLSASPGGSPIPIVDTSNLFVGPWNQPIFPGPVPPDPGFGSIPLQVAGAFKWAKALTGTTSGDPIISNAATLGVANAYNPATNTLDSLTAFCPASSRYSWQPSFGP